MPAEQSIEAFPGLPRIRYSVEPLHVIPKRIRVQHESGPGHDVRPIARFILLKKKEALMLLSKQPLKRELDLRCVSPP
jgi:hypothetical protein